MKSEREERERGGEGEGERARREKCRYQKSVQNEVYRDRFHGDLLNGWRAFSVR